VSRLRVLRASCISFFFQAEDGIRDFHVTGVQTCALPISSFANSTPCQPCAGGRAIQSARAASAGGSSSATRARWRAARSALGSKIGRASCRESVESSEVDRGSEERRAQLDGAYSG